MSDSLPKMLCCAALCVFLTCCAAGTIDEASGEANTAPTSTQSTPPANNPTTPTNPNTIDGIVQSGNGWLGSVNIAKNSADYLGMSLDQLEASGAPIADALKAHSDVEQAIRSVSAQTGVPSGLLAGLCYQESSFDNNATSGNPDPSAGDTDDVGITQAPVEDFTGNSWKDPETNLLDFVNKQDFLGGWRKYNSWGYVLRLWNSGQVLDPNDLSKQNNGTDPNYITEILGTHCLGKD